MAFFQTKTRTYVFSLLYTLTIDESKWHSHELDGFFFLLPFSSLIYSSFSATEGVITKKIIAAAAGSLTTSIYSFLFFFFSTKKSERTNECACVSKGREKKKKRRRKILLLAFEKVTTAVTVIFKSIKHIHLSSI